MLIRKITYRGWEDSVEMVNDTVRVVVSPQIGRIMHYSFKDEENLLWVNAVWEGKLLADIYDDPNVYTEESYTYDSRGNLATIIDARQNTSRRR